MAVPADAVAAGPSPAVPAWLHPCQMLWPWGRRAPPGRFPAGCCWTSPNFTKGSGKCSYTPPSSVMRLCFVVNSVRTQRPTYTTAHLGFAAARRGHEVAFVSVDALSIGQGNDGDVFGELVRPPRRMRARDVATYVKGLTDTAAPREVGAAERLRCRLPAQQPQRGPPRRRHQRRLQPGHRLRPAPEERGCDGRQRSRRSDPRRLQDVPGGLPGRAAPATLITRSLERVRASCASSTGPPSSSPWRASAARTCSIVERGQTANLAQMISTVRRDGYVIVQEYLPAAAKGDKRVLLVGGRGVRGGERGRRLPAHAPKDDIRNNMHVADRASAARSARPRRACATSRGRAWWPMACTSWASTSWAARSSRSTCSRRAASTTSTSCTASTWAPR